MFGANVNVMKIVFYYSGRFHDHGIRSYGSTFNENQMAAVLEATAAGSNLSGGAFGNIAANIMAPNAQVEELAIIPGGWGAGRLCFNAIIKVTSDYSNTGQTMIASGYTDRPGVSTDMQGRPVIDPNMRLFFNSVTELQVVNSLNNQQQVYQQTLVSATNQLLRPTHGDAAAGLNSTEFTMRPQDLMFVAGSAYMQQNGAAPIYDFRATMNDGMKFSARANNRPAEYLSRTVKNYTAASAGCEANEIDIATITDQTAGMLHDGSVLNNKFFSRLQADASLGNIRTGCSISYAELCQLDPNTDAVAQAPTPQAMKRVDGGYATIEGNEGWQGANLTTTAANLVGQVLPSLMSQFLCGRVSLIATNNVVMTGSSRYETQLKNIQGYADRMDMSGYINPLITAIENEIFDVITHRNALALSIAIDSELNGATTVKVSINNGPIESFSSATHADQLFSAVVTNNYKRLTDMAVDVQNIAEEITSAQYQSRGNMAQQSIFDSKLFGGMNGNTSAL